MINRRSAIYKSLFPSMILALQNHFSRNGRRLKIVSASLVVRHQYESTAPQQKNFTVHKHQLSLLQSHPSLTSCEQSDNSAVPQTAGIRLAPPCCTQLFGKLWCLTHCCDQHSPVSSVTHPTAAQHRQHTCMHTHSFCYIQWVYTAHTHICNYLDSKCMKQI